MPVAISKSPKTPDRKKPAEMMSLFIGLMSGTSLDGVDGVLARFPDSGKTGKPGIVASAHVPFDLVMRQQLMALQSAGHDEIEREALAANRLARLYAECVDVLLKKSALPSDRITAIGVHGQTIRHRPDLGFTRQTNNPALLAELSHIDVIADFRSRDIASGGQGAPLVPAFHNAVFGSNTVSRAVVNIGGIANISILPPDGLVSGFDTGPGNMLLDAWVQAHRNQPYDMDGQWAQEGHFSDELLKVFLDEPFFDQPPPKSTGRDLFHLDWLRAKLFASPRFASLEPVDVQATLTQLTAVTIAKAVAKYAPDCREVYLCGGGARNGYLVELLGKTLRRYTVPAVLTTSDALGIDPMQVESLAFAWLAYRFVNRKPGNLPAVTGAAGFRPLGALYPA